MTGKSWLFFEPTKSSNLLRRNWQYMLGWTTLVFVLQTILPAVKQRLRCQRVIMCFSVVHQFTNRLVLWLFWCIYLKYCIYRNGALLRHTYNIESCDVNITSRVSLCRVRCSDSTSIIICLKIKLSLNYSQDSCCFGKSGFILAPRLLCLLSVLLNCLSCFPWLPPSLVFLF